MTIYGLVNKIFSQVFGPSEATPKKVSLPFYPKYMNEHKENSHGTTN